MHVEGFQHLVESGKAVLREIKVLLGTILFVISREYVSHLSPWYTMEVDLITEQCWQPKATGCLYLGIALQLNKLRYRAPIWLLFFAVPCHNLAEAPNNIHTPSLSPTDCSLNKWEFLGYSQWRFAGLWSQPNMVVIAVVSWSVSGSHPLSQTCFGAWNNTCITIYWSH